MFDVLSDFESTITRVGLLVTIIAGSITLSGIIYTAYKILVGRRFRNIRKVLGIRENERIIVICSELPDGVERQMIEPREFIYHLKYGDLDALIEAMTTLVRVFPKNDIRLMSAGETLSANTNLDANIIVLGGPDYNKVAEHFIITNNTDFCYDYIHGEIALKIRETGQCLFHTNDYNDFGYVEKFPNPSSPNKSVLMFGGCHTLGVTASVKLLSAFDGGKPDAARNSIKTAGMISERFGKKADKFSFIVAARRIGNSIDQPGERDIIWIEDAQNILPSD